MMLIRIQWSFNIKIVLEDGFCNPHFLVDELPCSQPTASVLWQEVKDNTWEAPDLSHEICCRGQQVSDVLSEYSFSP